jgi:uncharacterized protein (TIGR00369 family)
MTNQRSEPGASAKPDLSGIMLKIPFLADLGVLCTQMGGGTSELLLTLEKRHQNSWDMAHGGVLMTLLDVAMAIAGRSADGDGRGVVTIEMKTSFMAPGRGALRARGTCVHKTSSMAFCEADIVDADDKLVSRASGTFKFIRREPAERLPDPSAGSTADSGADG